MSNDLTVSGSSFFLSPNLSLFAASNVILTARPKLKYPYITVAVLEYLFTALCVTLPVFSSTSSTTVMPYFRVFLLVALS